MWQRLLGWLKDLPIADAVDLRHAVFMQLMLLYEGIELPLNRIYLERFPPWPPLSGLMHAIDLGTDLVIAVSAWVGLVLLRFGRFRIAIKQFLAVLLAASLLTYGSFGYSSRPHDLVAIVALALSGLMLGRRALWTIYAMAMMVFAVGMTRDQYGHTHSLHPAAAAYQGLLSLAVGYLLVALILDRATAALRASLNEARRQRTQLQREMDMRERAQEQLLHAQKMDAVGRLTSGIAHDFNNVLGIILSFAQERHRLDEPHAHPGADAMALGDALEGVETAARRALAITGKLLGFSRCDITHVEVFDAGQALLELVPLLRQLLPAEIRLQLEPAPGPLPVAFDRSQFELAILNIAANARDAMPDGGRFTVKSTHHADDHLSILLSDTGCGMSDAVRRRIFEPFFTTKSAEHGTGLGLTVVGALVDRAGGSIDVISAPGQGTMIGISLPLTAAPDALEPPLLAATA